MSSPVTLPEEGISEPKPQGAPAVVRRSLITGTAIAIPLLVTLFVVGFVLNLLLNTISPFVWLFERIPFVGDLGQTVSQLLTILLFVFAIFVIGYMTEYRSKGEQLNRQFDEFMESLPGIGSVYRSFNEMSDLLLDSDTESFRDVKLVEYPSAGSYVVAFKTAETPDAITDDTGEEDMVTLFMPMAPNPMMGGFVIHVSRDRVIDVDLTVEQGINSIVTSGVVMGADDPALRGLTRVEMRELAESERVGERVSALDDAGDRDDRAREHRELYDSRTDEEQAETTVTPIGSPKQD